MRSTPFRQVLLSHVSFVSSKNVGRTVKQSSPPLDFTTRESSGMVDPCVLEGKHLNRGIEVRKCGQNRVE